MHCYIGYKLNYEADTKFLPIEILVIAYGLYYQELINLKWKFFLKLNFIIGTCFMVRYTKCC